MIDGLPKVIPDSAAKLASSFFDRRRTTFIIIAQATYSWVYIFSTCNLRAWKTALYYDTHRKKHDRRRMGDAVKICSALILQSSELWASEAEQSTIKFNYLSIIFGVLVHITGEAGRMQRWRRGRDRQGGVSGGMIVPIQFIYGCLKRERRRVGRRCMVHLRMDNDGERSWSNRTKTAIAPHHYSGYDSLPFTSAWPFRWAWLSPMSSFRVGPFTRESEIWKSKKDKWAKVRSTPKFGLECNERGDLQPPKKPQRNYVLRFAICGFLCSLAIAARCSSGLKRFIIYRSFGEPWKSDVLCWASKAAHQGIRHRTKAFTARSYAEAAYRSSP